MGPELLVGPLPDALRGNSSVIRDGEKIWDRDFLTGCQHMSHSLDNIEHHHFKYELFRSPGDVHVHFLGTATISFADGHKLQHGDEMQISAQGFSMPLRNRLELADSPTPRVRQL